MAAKRVLSADTCAPHQETVERIRWPAWLFWPLIVVMLGLSVLNTAVRMPSSR
jgi:hypothetical protein